MSQKVCRRCLIKEMGEKEYKEMIGKYIGVLKETDRCDEASYNKRLNVCKSCEKLNAGTCLSCGCYVEIRAAMKTSGCPNRKW